MPKKVSKTKRLRHTKTLSYSKVLAENIDSRIRTSMLDSLKMSEPSELQTKKIPLEQFALIFKRYPLCFRGAIIRANEVIARGFEIVANDKEARATIISFINKTNLKNLIFQICIDTDVFGNSFLEVIYSKNRREVADLAIIHPATMDFLRDSRQRIVFNENGKPRGFIQKSAAKRIEFEADQIAHFAFIRIGDELLGISLFEPALATIKRAMNIEEGIAQAIYRHGFPQFFIQIGNDNNPPTKKMIDDVASTVEDLNVKNEYVAPYYFDIKILEPSSTRSFDAYSKHFIDQIIADLGIPKPILMGTGEGTNKATADVQSRHFRAQIETMQSIIKYIIEEKVFKKIAELNQLKEVPKLEWNEVLPEEESAKIARIATVFEKGMANLKEVREMLRLPYIKNSENVWFSKQGAGRPMEGAAETRGRKPKVTNPESKIKEQHPTVRVDEIK